MAWPWPWTSSPPSSPAPTGARSRPPSRCASPARSGTWGRGSATSSGPCASTPSATRRSSRRRSTTSSAPCGRRARPPARRVRSCPGIPSARRRRSATCTVSPSSPPSSTTCATSRARRACRWSSELEAPSFAAFRASILEMGFDLRATARRAMAENGFVPDFPPEVHREVEALEETTPSGVRDLRSLPWSSIDNRESRDLDQIEVAERLPYDHIRLLVAISDVDEMVGKDSATDSHAGHSTTSVYAGPFVFPMLPERLSTDLTSLNPGQDRGAVVIEMDVGPAGAVVRHDVYRALVRSRAKLAYDAVGAWLEGGTDVARAGGGGGPRGTGA